MELNDIYEFYEEVKDSLKFLSISAVRLRILISLNESSKKLSEIRAETNLSSSTILHGMSELEKQNFILKEGERYVLSQTGKIITLKMIDMIRALVSVRKFKNLWLNHDISGIPQDLILDIGHLSNSVLVESEPIDVLKPHNTFSEFLLKSKYIRGVSPIFDPHYIELFKTMAQGSMNIELILTNEILDKLIDVLVQTDLDDLKELILKKKLKIWRIDEKIKVAFTVGDKFISLGLFSIDGIYDVHKDLISTDEKAIAWGNRLFNYYRDKAEEISL